MTDLEITRLCAEAMGLGANPIIDCENCGEYGWDYDPLNNDAQAMWLVKKFNLCIDRYSQNCSWKVYPQGMPQLATNSENINRAICECVAKCRT